MADNRHKTMTARVVGPRRFDVAAGGSQPASDLQKVNKLAGVIEKALTTTAQGEFFEASKSSNAARDKQLPEMFALRAEMQELKASIERKHAEEAETEETDKKTSVKPNASIIATINNIVAERLAAEMRDTNIHISRLQERAEKAEQKNTVLEEKIVSLETKLRKAVPKPGCTPDQFQALKRKVEAEQNLKVLEAKVDGMSNKFSENTKQMTSRLDQLEALELAKVPGKLEEVEELVKSEKKRRVSLKHKVEAANTTLTEHTSKIEAQDEKIEEQDGKIDDLQSKVDELDAKTETFADLQTKVNGLEIQGHTITSLQTKIGELEASDTASTAMVDKLKTRVKNLRLWRPEVDESIERLKNRTERDHSAIRELQSRDSRRANPPRRRRES